MKATTLLKAQAARTRNEAFVLVKSMRTGDTKIIHPGEAEPALDAHVARVLVRDKSEQVDVDGERLFLQVFNPPLRMIIVGAVHIAQALVPLAQISGFDVTVVDPRRAFAHDERFGSINLRTDWPDDAMADIQPDARTALVTLTHDPKIDDPALVAGLNSPVFYIGSLGSRRTHASRIERLKEAGFDEAQFGRICGPIGLDLGAVSPAEIALSIMAQVVQTLRKVPQLSAP